MPSLTKYPELKGMRECLVAYNRGYAKGAGITEKVIWVLNERCAFYSFAELPQGGHLTKRHRKDFPPPELVF